MKKWIRNTIMGFSTMLLSTTGYNSVKADNSDITPLKRIDATEITVSPSNFQRPTLLDTTKYRKLNAADTIVADMNEETIEEKTASGMIDEVILVKDTLAMPDSADELQNNIPEKTTNRPWKISVFGNAVFLYGDGMVGKNPFVMGVDGGVDISKEYRYWLFGMNAGLGKIEFDDLHDNTRIRNWNDYLGLYVGFIPTGFSRTDLPVEVKVKAGAYAYQWQSERRNLSTNAMISQDGGEGYEPFERATHLAPFVALDLEAKVNSKVFIGIGVEKGFVGDNVDAAVRHENDQLLKLRAYMGINLQEVQNSANSLLNNSSVTLNPWEAMFLWTDQGTKDGLPDRNTGNAYGLEFGKYFDFNNDDQAWLGMLGSIYGGQLDGNNSARNTNYKLWIRNADLGIKINPINLASAIGGRRNKSAEAPDSYLEVDAKAGVSFFESERKNLQTGALVARYGTDRQGSLFGNVKQAYASLGMKAMIKLFTDHAIYYSPSVSYVIPFTDKLDAEVIGRHNDAYAIFSLVGFTFVNHEKRNAAIKEEKPIVSPGYDAANAQLQSQKKDTVPAIIEPLKYAPAIGSTDTIKPMPAAISIEQESDAIKTFTNQMVNGPDSLAEAVADLDGLLKSFGLNARIDGNAIQEHKPQSQRDEVKEGAEYVVQPGDALQRIVKHHYGYTDNQDIINASDIVARVSSKKYHNKRLLRDDKAVVGSKLIDCRECDGQRADKIMPKVDTLFLYSKDAMDVLIKHKRLYKEKGVAQNVSMKDTLTLAKEVSMIYEQENFNQARNTAKLLSTTLNSSNMDVYSLLNMAAENGRLTKGTMKSVESSVLRNEIAFNLYENKSQVGLDGAIEMLRDEFKIDITKSTASKIIKNFDMATYRYTPSTKSIADDFYGLAA